MKQILIGLAYAVGIILVEILTVVAWFGTPLVINFDASPIVLATIIMLPVITTSVATKNNRDNLVEKGIIIGLLLWSVMLLPICWTLPMLISKKLVVCSLLIYLVLSIAGSLCSGNIRFLQGLKSPNKTPETD